jgi:hypothetical protein
MKNVKITKVLGDDKYEIKVDPINTSTHPIIIGACHDYALFASWTYLFTEDGVSIKNAKGGSNNTLAVSTSVQIPIRVMGELALPYFNESKYLKEEHFSKYGMWNETPVSMWADSATVHVYDKGQKKFIEMSRELYEKLNP